MNYDRLTVRPLTSVDYPARFGAVCRSTCARSQTWLGSTEAATLNRPLSTSDRLIMTLDLCQGTLIHAVICDDAHYLNRHTVLNNYHCSQQQMLANCCYDSRHGWFFRPSIIDIKAVLMEVTICQKITGVRVFLGRLPKVDLIILEGEKCPSVRMSVRPYIRPSTKSFFDLNEIWYIGRGRWVIHNGMPYGRIQGQGHEPLKVWIPSIFKTYLLRHLQWELASDH